MTTKGERWKPVRLVVNGDGIDADRSSSTSYRTPDNVPKMNHVAPSFVLAEEQT